MRFDPRLLALPALMTLAACGSTGSGGSSSPAAGGGGIPVTLDAQNYRFNPATVTARAGDKITVTVNNRDGVEHNFSISELGVSQDIEKGESKSVTFTATGSNNLQFFCKYHKATNGMVGTLNLGGTNAAPAPASSAAPSPGKPSGSGY
ncbi:MAG TPA: cupredoxin domain-containing protein [Candidatus Dormibacteraeota bacterium]|jgi:plastocyanin